MSGSKEFTIQEVARYGTLNDLWIVIHGKVYDCTSCIDEHPGAGDALIDFAGQDCSEAFEDVGHSDEAREMLKQLFVGHLKPTPDNHDPNSGASPSRLNSTTLVDSDTGWSKVDLYAAMLIGCGLGYITYKYSESFHNY